MESPYSALPLQGDNRVGIGTAFISMVEPHRGHEHAYVRWYEDDHMYSGAMAFPYWFAGRRWVATRELQELRAPAQSAVAQPLHAGCFLGTYWLAPGHHEDQARWLTASVQRLLSEGRMFAERTHVLTGFFERTGCARRDDPGPRDFQALDHPYRGIALEVLDARDDDGRPALQEWLTAEHAPSLMAGSPAAMCVTFAPLPWPNFAEASWFDYAPPSPRRIVALWFLDADPRECWADTLAGHGDAVAASGLGRVELLAPFIPTVPGTDRYLDELR